MGGLSWMAESSRNDYLMGCLLQWVYFIFNHKNICNLLRTGSFPLLCDSCPPDEFIHVVLQQLLGALTQVKALPGAKCKGPDLKELAGPPRGDRWRGTKATGSQVA